jgi:hypothetical protein
MSRRPASCGLVLLMINAASVGAARAACYGPDQALSPAAIGQFVKSPGAVLDDPANFKGGAGMIRTVRDLASSSPSTLPAILSLLPKANSDQKSAIGTGLANAATLCMGSKSREDALYAADIQAKLASAPESKEAFDKFAALTPIPNVPTGAAGAGGFSGGGSGGQVAGISSPSGFSGTFQAFANHGTPSGSINYFTGGVTGASGGSVSRSTTSSASRTVTR